MLKRPDGFQTPIFDIEHCQRPDGLLTLRRFTMGVDAVVSARRLDANRRFTLP